ncbi:alpha-2Db adrenergic receptor-like [Gigantopelta aegis]|uniref:alpha-2Db adrenergic receptor-like n=1 Tax=Gigantopelta aegis TaxID=1735272 RepID=UPI001B88933E|nr:alpha-2Db adrenergic receptor-like [Gigantopelta aegis]XP_041352706.1 alpha-2Db adrenergic receptor-like [Gigantopelta aegis]XP_041352707.1 alpha-2Db adrenergic receptor-like [Gigantopelta aegis]
MEVLVQNATTNVTERGTVEIVIVATIHLVILFTAIGGNVAVICAIYKSNKLRDEVSNLFLVNLAITDLSSATVVMTSAFISLVANYWPLGWVWCYAVCMVNYLLIIVSMLTLCFISIDRYLAIVYPLQYISKLTKVKILLLIGYAWFHGISFSIVPVLFQWIKYDYWEYVCAIEWHEQRQKALYYVIMAFVFCFLLPGLVLMFLYCRVLKVAHEKSRRIRVMTFPATDRPKYCNSHKAIKSLLIVIVMYFLCMTPFSLTKLYKVASQKEKSLPGYLNLVSSIIAYLSSAVNPLIYGIFRKDFRQAYKLIFRKLFIQSHLARNTNNTAETSFDRSEF